MTLSPVGPDRATDTVDRDAWASWSPPNLKDIREGKATDPAIYAGDIVVVDGSRLKEIQQQVFQSLQLMSLGVFRPLGI